MKNCGEIHLAAQSIKSVVALGLTFGAVLCGLLAAIETRPSTQVQGASSQSRDSESAAAKLRVANLEGLAAAREPLHVRVRLTGVPDSTLRQRLDSAGIRLQSFAGHESFVALATPQRFDAARLASLESLVEVRPLAPGEKLHRVLLVADGRLDATRKTADAQPFADALVYARFHEDVTRDKGETLLRGLDAQVLGWARSTNTFVARIARAAIDGLARCDEVLWIEPALPGWTHMNDGVLSRTEADVVQSPPYDLNGQGVSVLLYDTGLADGAHPDLAGRVFAGDDAPVQLHATHIAGIIGGSGVQSGGRLRGVAPGVEIASFSYLPDDQGGIPLFVNLGDLEEDYRLGIDQFGVGIASNSIGPNLCIEGFPCIYTGDYGSVSSLLDGLVTGSGGRPLVIVWAAGNERTCTRCRDDFIHTVEGYHSVAPPACAKNLIVVGAVNSDDDSMTAFSSWGPCDDGRLKPDLVAPGCQTNGDRGVTSCNDGGGYWTLCGTSMAAPVVAGAAALLIQEHRNLHPSAADPLPSTIKAVLVHTAEDLDPPGPDFRSGYGSIRIPPAVDLLRAESCFEGEMNQSESYSVLIPIPEEGAKDIRVTLAWDDVPGLESAANALVNDLDLLVYSPRYEKLRWPWTLNPGSPSNQAYGYGADHVNNIEQVFVPATGLDSGIWRAEVRGFRVPHGPQRFSICVSPESTRCTPQGWLWADRPRYTCEDRVVIEVADCDANRDPFTADVIEVTTRSSSAPFQQFPLVETSPSAGHFRGTIPLSASGSPGSLRVANSNYVVAIYRDDDGVSARQVSVVVDCKPPYVRDVSLGQSGPNAVTIQVATLEPSTISVRYGRSCADLSGMVQGSYFTDLSSIAVGGLDHDTAYFFAIMAVDEAGNSTFDDNGGRCYVIRTADSASSLTEQFESNLDLAFTSIRFVPDGSSDFYAACAEPLNFLPVSPDLGQLLPVTSDVGAVIELQPRDNVSLFGVRAMYYVAVSPKGFISLDQGDRTYLETLGGHFRIPRVSALFHDFEPGRDGRVVYLRLADRIVVTWLNVSEYERNNRNTFQVELYFDGRITISFENLDATSGITGLSRGSGITADFRETDLSAATGCRPRPPHAAPLNVSALSGVPVRLTLMADDDGLPSPPGRISFRVRSLPALGRLIAPGFGAITPAPFTLPDGRDSLLYMPLSGYAGPDSFAYSAHDGGTAPEGGESLPATVSIRVSPDCNNNRRPDDDDLVTGFSPDCDANNVPDECQCSGNTGDLDADRDTDLADFAALQNCFGRPFCGRCLCADSVPDSQLRPDDFRLFVTHFTGPR